MGTFACLELARRGLRVIGVDQFAPPHDRGSHSGDTRVFRIVYAEHPDYVPLAQRAGELWDRFGEEAGRALLHRCGMLSAGPPESALITGTRASADAHRLRLEELSSAEVSARFPALALPRGWAALFEPTAGWVDVGAALRFGIEQAARAGVEVRLDTRVEAWESRGGECVVRTSEGRFATERLVIAAGAWSGRLLAGLDLPLKIVRKALVWVNPLDPQSFDPAAFPVFATADKFFYGFPNIRGDGVKLATHCSESAPLVDADQVQAEPGPDEIRPALEAAAALLPSLAGALPEVFGRVIRSKSCLYCMTPDEHFVIDRHPHFGNVSFAAGFSGHGFKFAPAIGEVLADLAVHGTTKLPVGFLSLNRPALRVS
jgi:sarcosine oxidase